jgi:hypothetical protein
MLTSYKFGFVSRDTDSGVIIKAGIRFFEGEISTKRELDVETMEEKSITRYRRTKRLGSADLPHFDNFKEELDGSELVIFTPKDFGVIKSDDELRVFLNKKLALDKEREPIATQKETNLEIMKTLTEK